MTTNKEFLTALVNDPKTPQTVKSALKGVDLADMETVFNTITSMDDVHNAFIKTLVNRCVATRFFQKVYENPLKMLHHGKLGFGDSVQQVFVKMGQRKGFYTNFDEGGSPEKNLIGKRVPDVEVDVIKQNFAHKYKVSVSFEELQKAFMNEGGLSQMASGLINSNIDTAETDEYEDMKGLLIRETAETKEITDPSNAEGHKYDKGVIFQINDDPTLKKTAIARLGKQYTPHMICEKVRELSGKMKFKSENYNLAKVKTFSRKEELIFVTTPTISAKIDVNVLAQAFNVSSADVNIRTIEIDSFPKLGDDNVLGIVMDKWLIQAFDIINMAKTFDVGSELYTNYFLHRQGIMALCKFAQCCVITDGDPNAVETSVVTEPVVNTEKVVTEPVVNTEKVDEPQK